MHLLFLVLELNLLSLLVAPGGPILRSLDLQIARTTRPTDSIIEDRDPMDLFSVFPYPFPIGLTLL